MNEPLRTTLADAVEFLEVRRIPYAVIGGIAASLRGEPRVTADIDFVIGVDLDRSLQLLKSIEVTPFLPLFENAAEVVQRSFILPLRHRKTGIRVDMAVGLSGFENQAISRAGPVDILGLSVMVATAEDLVIMKLLAGRPRDEQDIRGIMMVHGERLDWDYCLRLAADLGQAVEQNLVSPLQKLREEFESA